jgi:alkanesulfonate monooxygenase SsuD/methylene tetrahydromethanopterin reductase-like flavin-dependent oxidoreductase (luciferase family)
MITPTQEPLSFGLSLPNRAVLFGLPFEVLLETAVLADESGQFGSVWVGDNYLSKPRLEALIALSAVAARTRQVKLGTICLATFPLRHPLELAIQWASLDVVSGGRTLLVVCTGGAARYGPKFATELDAFRVASQERLARMEEGIELLRRFWGSEPVSYDGQFYRFENVEALPKPVQRHIPIGIAVNPASHGRRHNPEVEERALRRVARIADGWQTDATPPEVFRERWERIQEYSAEYGRAGQVNHVSLHLMVNINDDAAAARREAIEFLGKYYGEGHVSDEALGHWLAFGSPQAVIEKIASFIEAGCTTPVLRFVAHDQRGQLERCLSEVLPALVGTTP